LPKIDPQLTSDKRASRRDNMKLYGYNLTEKRKFVVDIEDICDCINMDYGFSDDYFVYVNEQDRDLHFNDNIKIESEQKR
jgi:hypothetical protein